MSSLFNLRIQGVEGGGGGWLGHRAHGLKMGQTQLIVIFSRAWI